MRRSAPSSIIIKPRNEGAVCPLSRVLEHQWLADTAAFRNKGAKEKDSRGGPFAEATIHARSSHCQPVKGLRRLLIFQLAAQADEFFFQLDHFEFTTDNGLLELLELGDFLT